MIEKLIRLKYDTEANAGYIYIKNFISYGETAKQIELRDQEDNIHMVLDFNSENELLGIELLSVGNLSKCLINGSHEKQLSEVTVSTLS
ncbi:MAG TPA: DUF2283 domain-containing protein [Thermodesulfovibrionia bacterium]|nr:DUF2283 domain-containing protein [Thermodesulfovibrionia bacterium]